MCYEGIGFFSFGWLWMILFWCLIVGLVVWAVTKISKRDGSELRTKHIEIAKERYAKGEILKEEFEQIKKDLS
jgi:putative membrane protein